MTATPPLWITGLPRPDSWRSLRQAGYPQLLSPPGDKEYSIKSGQITPLHKPDNLTRHLQLWQRTIACVFSEHSWLIASAKTHRLDSERMDTMTIVDTVRDFLDGLARGIGLFLRERNDLLEQRVDPRAVLK